MKTLSKEVVSLWAKKENRNGQELWLPLVSHLVDAQNVIGWLYENWLNDNQKELIRQNLPDDEIKKLVKFVGYMHDIGKATPSFQTKPSYNHDPELDTALLEKLLRNGFDQLKEYDPSSRRESPHAIAGETILESFGLNESVGAIIGAHHGMPAHKFFDYEAEQLCPYTSNYLQSDSNSKLQQLWRKVYQELIDYGLKLTGFSSLQAVPKITEQQAVLLTGLLIMADWIASSEFLNNDPTKPMFPLISLDKGYYDIDSVQRFHNAILTWDISGHWMPKPVLDVEHHYESRWHFKPRPVQSLMSQVIGRISDPGIIIIEAPMGLGKSEIAMTAAEQLSFTTGTRGFFMGLPTQATSNAMFSRVDKWVDQLAKEDNTSLPIKLMHGKAQFNDENQSLPRAENVGEQDSVVVNSWFSGKKSMLADFSIGTIDHLLLMSLKQKHLFLRHLGLSGKVVIIDEAHAYDSFMNSYLRRTLQWLGAYRIPVIALSATLPKKKRAALIGAYYQGKYGHRLKSVGKWQNNQSYPLLTYLDGKSVKQFDDFPPATNPKINRVIRLDCNDDQLIRKVVESIDGGGTAGIIVNTVQRAQELSRLVPENILTMTLHSSFLATDRSRLENKLQNYIGKNANRPEKMIVIGTQVLEQSLDIDFDVLFADIAPMDLILQRIGRLHRHNIKRPAKLATPTIYILGIKSFGDYGDANEAVYEKYLLMKTDYFLPEKIMLPNDISLLVQKVYDSATDKEIKDIQEPRTELEIFEKKEKQKAKAYQIAKPKSREDLHGWLDRTREGIQDDASAEAAVRDIKESIEVILLKHTNNQNFLIEGQNLNEVPDRVIAQQLIRLPNAVTPNIEVAIKELEKRTAKYYHDWQNSIWLKGALALPLNNKLETKFGGYRLHYSQKLGLMYKRDEKDERKAF